MAEYITNKTKYQFDKTANIDLIFEYVVNHEYPLGSSRTERLLYALGLLNMLPVLDNYATDTGPTK